LIIVEKLFYCPVKSISFSYTNELFIFKNLGIKNDRVFAFTKNLNKNKSNFILKNSKERKLNNFLTLKNKPELNEYSFDYLEKTLIFKRNNKKILSINPKLNSDVTKICKLIETLLNIKTKINLLYDDKNPFFDTMPSNSISLINLNSVDDFQNKINHQVEFERFRGNIYFKGVPPWEERNWINKIIKINNIPFLVQSHISRCSATNLQPNTSNFTINLPLELKKIYKHLDMGVYLIPLNDGYIKVGDKLELDDKIF